MGHRAGFAKIQNVPAHIGHGAIRKLHAVQEHVKRIEKGMCNWHALQKRLWSVGLSPKAPTSPWEPLVSYLTPYSHLMFGYFQLVPPIGNKLGKTSPIQDSVSGPY